MFKNIINTIQRIHHSDNLTAGDGSFGCVCTVFFPSIFFLIWCFPQGSLTFHLPSAQVFKKWKSGVRRHPCPTYVTCPTSVAVVVACCLVLELCLKCHKSLSQLFVCAEVVENVACLGLSQGLVGQARWSG